MATTTVPRETARPSTTLSMTECGEMCDHAHDQTKEVYALLEQALSVAELISEQCAQQPNGQTVSSAAAALGTVLQKAMSLQCEEVMWKLSAVSNSLAGTTPKVKP